MKRLFWLIWGVIILVLVGAAPQPPEEFQALFFVEAKEGSGSRWVGTAFAVSPHHIVTAGHVTVVALRETSEEPPISSEELAPKPGEPLFVRHVLTHKVFVSRVAVFRDDLDFALLRCAVPLPKALEVSPRQPQLGEPLKTLALAIRVGAPNDYPHYVLFHSFVASPILTIRWSATGVIDPSIEFDTPAFYTDKAGQPGFSGAPVLGADNKVLGIHVGSLRALGIVIPSASWAHLIPLRNRTVTGEDN